MAVPFVSLSVLLITNRRLLSIFQLLSLGSLILDVALNFITRFILKSN